MAKLLNHLLAINLVCQKSKDKPKYNHLVMIKRKPAIIF